MYFGMKYVIIKLRVKGSGGLKENINALLIMMQIYYMIESTWNIVDWVFMHSSIA